MRSYIVSISKIKKIEGNQIRLGKKSVPIGRVYKMNVDKIVREQSLVSKGNKGYDLCAPMTYPSW